MWPVSDTFWSKLKKPYSSGRYKKWNLACRETPLHSFFLIHMQTYTTSITVHKIQSDVNSTCESNRWTKNANFGINITQQLLLLNIAVVVTFTV